MQQTINTYNRLSKLLHWVSALLVFSLFALGFWMVGLDYYSQWYQSAPHWHKSVGLTLAAITLCRLLWKHLHGSPKVQGTDLERKAAISVHHLLYLLLFTLFISGYLISTADGRAISVFNWFTLPSLGELINNQAELAGLIHEYSAYLLIALAGLHALAACKHHFIDKDNTLKKML